MVSYWNIFLLIMIQIYGNTVAVVMKCPTFQLNFQKIVGVRPPISYLTENNIIYMQPTNSVQNSMPLSILCWKICAKDPDCRGFVLLINENTCYAFSFFTNSGKYYYMPPNTEFVADLNAIYYEKTCLKVTDRCKNKLWAITKIPGNTLIYQGKKTIQMLTTKRECAENCILEKEFRCLSASFSPSYKNNYARFGDGNKLSETVGRCILSDKDKILQTDAFRAATKDEEYIENQCYDHPVENIYCSFELYTNSAFLYADILFNNISQKECQSRCLEENRFYCQGVTFERNINTSKCFLHSDDLISMGPRSLKLALHSTYMRRVRCLNISVVCNDDEMTIKYLPNDWFRGKLYTSSHSEECSAHGNGTEPTILRLPIGNEIKESRCGVLRAYELKGSVQRIFVSTLLVVQYNLNVQTQGDRLIKVGCILSNISKESEIPGDVSLESSLAFTQPQYPNEGSIQINTSTYLPRVRMQIVDADQSFETNDVHIGQNLDLQIIVDPSNIPYDIQARSLMAYSDHSGLITLIDEKGCPTDLSIFPALENVSGKNKKMLKGHFHAFKFAGTPVVNFGVIIHFCKNKCPEPNCNQTTTSRSTKREKRSDNYGSALNVSSKISTGVDIQKSFQPVYLSGPFNYFTTINESLPNSKNDQNNDKENPTIKNVDIPLKLQLHVRGPYYGETDTLVCGENSKILVSGFDFRNPEEWCINNSLLIAILIFWLIIQIILIALGCYFIKKYKRMISVDEDHSTLHRSDGYMDYMDDRKVRWADQGTMSEFTPSQT